jgi:hypothetical protein
MHAARPGGGRGTPATETAIFRFDGRGPVRRLARTDARALSLLRNHRPAGRSRLQHRRNPIPAALTEARLAEVSGDTPILTDAAGRETDFRSAG